MIKTMQHDKSDESQYFDQNQFDNFILLRPDQDLADRRRHCNEQLIE